MKQNETFSINYDINIEFKPIFTTGFLNIQFDEIEINACCYDKESDSISLCITEEAEFWSVYLHDVNGGTQCIADCKTYEAAQQLEKLLLMILYTNTQTKKQLRKNLIISAVQEAYNTFLKEDERIAKQPETEAIGHVFSRSGNICIWLKRTHFPNAKIMGYSMEDNPTAIIGITEGGHDFLFIEERYIVDFWYGHVKRLHGVPIIIDIMDKDKINISRYGNPAKWEIVQL